jgi:hypothetical protein
MRSKSLASLLNLLSTALEERGALVIYGAPGTLRTRLAFLLCSRFKPCVYIGAGRHARLKRLPEGVLAGSTTSFYEELLKVLECTGLVKNGAVRALAIDELLANIVPYRASLSESIVMRMVLTEIQLIRSLVERGGKSIIVCGEDPRTGGPLALRYLRQLKPHLLRTSVVEGVLSVEERELGDPVAVMWKAEVEAGEVEKSCEALLLS